MAAIAAGSLKKVDEIAGSREFRASSVKAKRVKGRVAEVRF